MTIRLLTSLTVFCLVGCTTVATDPRPAAYYESLSDETRPESLFAGDEALLSDEAIKRILEFDYQPPPLSRIALMQLGGENWSRWSEELSIVSDRIRSDVVERLRASPRVYDVAYLPALLAPANASVARLREAAARFQADLLLVYQADCRSFERYRLFSANEGRAYCTVEAALLDTRTGLVPFTSVASQAFEATPAGTDLNFRETMLKAELDAVGAGLAEISRDIVGFLDRQ